MSRPILSFLFRYAILLLLRQRFKFLAQITSAGFLYPSDSSDVKSSLGERKNKMKKMLFLAIFSISWMQSSFAMEKNIDREMYNIKKKINIHDRDYNLDRYSLVFKCNPTPSWDDNSRFWKHDRRQDENDCPGCKHLNDLELSEKEFWVDLDLPPFDSNITDLDNLKTLHRYYRKKADCIIQIHKFRRSTIGCSIELKESGIGYSFEDVQINQGCKLCLKFRSARNSYILIHKAVNVLLGYDKNERNYYQMHDPWDH